MKVGGAARRKTYDPAYRPRRVGLRPRDARDGLEGGTARRQMQKSPSGGNVHFEPSLWFSSFDPPVGGGERGRWNGEAKHRDGLDVEDQPELARLRDRRVGDLRTLEDAPNINTACRIATAI